MKHDLYKLPSFFHILLLSAPVYVQTCFKLKALHIPWFHDFDRQGGFVPHAQIIFSGGGGKISKSKRIFVLNLFLSFLSSYFRNIFLSQRGLRVLNFFQSTPCPFLLSFLCSCEVPKIKGGSSKILVCNFSGLY